MRLSEAKKRKLRAEAKTLSERVKYAPTPRAFPKGRPIRLSSVIYDMLNKKRRREESFDEFFRRLMNYPQRDGEHEILFECYALPSTGEHFPTKAKAKAKAMKNGVLKGKSGEFEQPKRMREVI